MTFRGLVASPDGSRVIRTTGECDSTEAAATAMGHEAGERLKAEGGAGFFTW